MTPAKDLLSAALLADMGAENETAERTLDAALSLFLEFGFRRTTMEDVARRGGIGRMTVYRHYEDKHRLFQAVLLREFRRAVTDVGLRLSTRKRGDAFFVEAFVLAVQGARKHPLIQRLMDTDPEWLLPYLTLKAGELLQISVAFVAALLRQEQAKGGLQNLNVALASELLVRLMQSIVLTPGGAMAPEGDEELRRVARRFLPSILGSSKLPVV